VLARSPNETRAMIDTLAAHFERCPAGPLALHDPIYADNEPVEFLGYLFDPTRREIGVSAGALEKLLRRLNPLESARERKMVGSHSARISEIRHDTGVSAADPLSERFPVEIWSALRSFRAGFSQVPADAEELQYLKENSRWLAEWTGSAMACALHDNVFADRSTPEGRVVLALLNKSRM